MRNIKILDCTLRDGGYCNQWYFEFHNIKNIMQGLFDAEIDIIECGLLTNKVQYNINITKFNSLDEVGKFIPDNRLEKIYVCLMNYGEYSIDDIPTYDGTSLDGIRVAFHKKDMKDALEFCKGLKDKGYKVFVQPMVTLNYSDLEFLALIELVNHIEPFAFYIVDSFGVMKGKDLIRLFYIVEHNLVDNIYIGYHSHNNLQMAFSNAQSLVAIQTKRNIIIDTCVFGMGRGAGNLNTELFVDYLNDTTGTAYNLKPLLNIIDHVLNRFYQQKYWGYSLWNYLSAIHNVHPNYAEYLSDKQTLTVENMNDIFSMMSNSKKNRFDKEYIEKLYIKYLAIGHGDEFHEKDFKKIISNKKVLIIAPGKSINDEKEKVVNFADREDVVTISINFNYKYYDTDFIFLSNLRRYRELDENKLCKCITTSNIPAEGVYLQAEYASLLNKFDAIKDNAGMMLIRFLINMGVNEIYLAGMDGYSNEEYENYADQDMIIMTRKDVLNEINVGITKMLTEYSKQIEIKFLTEQKHVTIMNSNC